MGKKAEKAKKREAKAEKRAERVIMKQNVNDLKEEKAEIKVKIFKKQIGFFNHTFCVYRQSAPCAKLDVPNSPTRLPNRTVLTTGRLLPVSGLRRFLETLWTPKIPKLVITMTIV